MLRLLDGILRIPMPISLSVLAEALLNTVSMRHKMMPIYIYIHFVPNTQTTRASANDIRTTDNPTKLVFLVQLMAEKTLFAHYLQIIW